MNDGSLITVHLSVNLFMKIKKMGKWFHLRGITSPHRAKYICKNQTRLKTGRSNANVAMEVQWWHMGSTRNIHPWSTWSWIQSLTLVYLRCLFGRDNSSMVIILIGLDRNFFSFIVAVFCSNLHFYPRDKRPPFFSFFLLFLCFPFS